MPLGMVLADANNVRLWAAGELGTPANGGTLPELPVTPSALVGSRWAAQLFPAKSWNLGTWLAQWREGDCFHRFPPQGTI